MALLRRLTRLFRADLHAVLDCIEEPAALLRQAVREMEDALAQDEQRAKLMSHEQDELATRSTDAERVTQELERKLDLCFDSEQTELARGLVKRKLELEAARTKGAARRAGLTKQLTELQTRIAENRGRLDSMRQKLELLGDDDSGAELRRDDCRAERGIGDDEIEIAWLQEKHRRGLS